jgi:hypothetical protein
LTKQEAAEALYFLLDVLDEDERAELEAIIAKEGA